MSYDGQADFAGSLNEGYRVIRERVAAGGPGWQRKDCNMDLAIKKNGAISQFRPEEAHERVSVLEAAIRHARTMRDWEALETAVTLQIEEQRQFVKWWEENVRAAGKPNSRGPALISAQEAEDATDIKHQQVSKWRKRLTNPDKYRDTLYGAAYRNAMAEEHNHRAQGTGENEWYTPERYIEMARSVLGGIDLDPASSTKAQEVVGARAFFSRSQDGLRQPWGGRVWLNPPYSQPDIGNFVNKLIDERAADRIDAAIMLTHNYTDTAWFHTAADIADAICFPRGRIKFVDAEGGTCAPTQGQAFFYYGEEAGKFAEVFKDIGQIFFPWSGEV